MKKITKEVKETPKNEKFFSIKNILVNILFSFPSLLLLSAFFYSYSYKSSTGAFTGIFIVLVGLLRKYFGNKITLFVMIIFSVVLYFTLISLDTVIKEAKSSIDEEVVPAESKADSWYREPFVAGCIKSGSSDKFCNCVFDGIKETVGFKKLEEAMIAYKDNGESSSEFIEFQEIANNERLKCLGQ